MRYLIVLSMCLFTSCAVFKGGAKVNKETKAMIGTTWTLDLLPAFEKEATAKPVMLVFEKDGKVHGNTGCNTFGGHYTVVGDSISITQIISTKMACNPGMETEARFLQALNNANQYLMTNESFLLKKDGKVLASFNSVKKEE